MPSTSKTLPVRPLISCDRAASQPPFKAGGRPPQTPAKDRTARPGEPPTPNFPEAPDSPCASFAFLPGHDVLSDRDTIVAHLAWCDVLTARQATVPQTRGSNSPGTAEDQGGSAARRADPQASPNDGSGRRVPPQSRTPAARAKCQPAEPGRFAARPAAACFPSGNRARRISRPGPPSGLPDCDGPGPTPGPTPDGYGPSTARRS
jgi:hypothetical protein